MHFAAALLRKQQQTHTEESPTNTHTLLRLPHQQGCSNESCKHAHTMHRRQAQVHRPCAWWPAVETPRELPCISRIAPTRINTPGTGQCPVHPPLGQHTSWCPTPTSIKPTLNQIKPHTSTSCSVLPLLPCHPFLPPSPAAPETKKMKNLQQLPPPRLPAAAHSCIRQRLGMGRTANEGLGATRHIPSGQQHRKTIHLPPNFPGKKPRAH